MIHSEPEILNFALQLEPVVQLQEDFPAAVKHDARKGGGKVFLGGEGVCVHLKII